jgi:hypothetical protein
MPFTQMMSRFLQLMRTLWLFSESPFVEFPQQDTKFNDLKGYKRTRQGCLVPDHVVLDAKLRFKTKEECEETGSNAHYFWDDLFPRDLLDYPLFEIRPFYLKYCRMYLDTYATMAITTATVEDMLDLLYKNSGQDSVEVSNIFIPGFLFRNELCVTEFLHTNRTEKQKLDHLKRGLRSETNIAKFAKKDTLGSLFKILTFQHWDLMSSYYPLAKLVNKPQICNITIDDITTLVNMGGTTCTVGDTEKSPAQFTNVLLAELLIIYINSNNPAGNSTGSFTEVSDNINLNTNTNSPSTEVGDARTNSTNGHSTDSTSKRKPTPGTPGTENSGHRRRRNRPINKSDDDNSDHNSDHNSDDNSDGMSRENRTKSIAQKLNFGETN